MIRQIRIAYIPANGAFSLDGCSESGITDGVMLHELLEGAAEEIRRLGLLAAEDQEQSESPEAPRVLRVVQDTDSLEDFRFGPGERIAVESTGPGKCRQTEALGMLSFAKQLAEQNASKQRAQQLMQQMQAKAIVGPDGRRMS